MIKNKREETLLEKGFKKIKTPKKYNEMGNCYSINPAIGEGYFWVYKHEDLFSIVIHDFYFYEEHHLNYKLLEYLSIIYFESISGEELKPYHRLTAGVVKSRWCNGQSYQAIFHKNIPIKSIGIELNPKYYEEYLADKYDDEYINPQTALLNINETANFPEMVLLLNQIKNYKGTGMAGKLYYEGKVSEALALIIEREKSNKRKKTHTISEEDIEHLSSVASYISDHYAHDLTLEKLSRIACMGTTKLKKTFRELYNSTITEYIQNRRIGQAEHLLSDTDFPVKQVALIVGYKSTPRFIELFKRNTGMTPLEFRKLAKR